MLIWTGPGWPLLSGPSPDLNDRNRGRYFTSIVDLNTQLREAHITLYNAVPLNLAAGMGLRSLLYRSYLKGVASPSKADAPNLALQVLAIQSGGLVFDNDGDLAGQIARCVEDAQAYYELTFDAARADDPDVYHRLEIRPQQARPVRADEDRLLRAAVSLLLRMAISALNSSLQMPMVGKTNFRKTLEERSMLKRLVREEAGAGLLEYGVLVGLVALATIAAMKGLAQTLGYFWQTGKAKVEPYWPVW